MNYEVYHNTLSEALDTVEKFCAASDAVPEPGWRLDRYTTVGSVSYGQTSSENFRLESLKGKTTRKWLHVIIYRMETGRYELTVYFL